MMAMLDIRNAMLGCPASAAHRSTMTRLEESSAVDQFTIWSR
jgi:hypothetical protein